MHPTYTRKLKSKKLAHSDSGEGKDGDKECRLAAFQGPPICNQQCSMVNIAFCKRMLGHTRLIVTNQASVFSFGLEPWIPSSSIH